MAPNQRLLLTGATGFVGSCARDRLTAAGWEVVCPARKPGLAPPPMNDIQAVVHLAGIAHQSATGADLFRVNADWPRRLFHAASDAGVGAFIWLSSVKALGNESKSPFREDDTPAPSDPYGISKARGEQLLLEFAPRSTTRLAIVRSPLIYGPGVRANFQNLLQLAALGRAGVPLPLGEATAPRSFVSVRNLCALIEQLTEAGTGIFHVTDGESLSVRDLLERLGVPRRRLLAVPRAMMRRTFALASAGASYDRLFKPLELDTNSTQHRLGWSPPYAIDDELGETASWFRSRSRVP